MKSLKEKLFYLGMYFTVFAVTMICLWRLDSMNDNSKQIQNETIVMNEK